MLTLTLTLAMARHLAAKTSRRNKKEEDKKKGKTKYLEPVGVIGGNTL